MTEKKKDLRSVIPLYRENDNLIKSYQAWVEAEHGFKPNVTQSVNGLLKMAGDRIPAEYKS